MAETKFGSDFLGQDDNVTAEAAQEADERAARIAWATETVNFGALERHLAGESPEPLMIGDTPIAIDRPRSSRDRARPKYGRNEPRSEEPTMFGSEPMIHYATSVAAEPTTASTVDGYSTSHDQMSAELTVQGYDAPFESDTPIDAAITDAIELDAGSLVYEDEAIAKEPTSSDMLTLVDEACEAETQILAAGAMPPERVKFTASLEVMVEGHGDLHRGVVLNLSSTGLACAMPIELTPGQRVWVRFKLGLAEDPLSLLCAVIWRRDANPQHVLYGLQFTSLAEDEATRIGTTVRERLDGRAADWPLPLMPTGELPRPTPRKQTSTWTSAAFGMIGGMALALALSALPHFIGTSPANDELPLPNVAQVDPLPPLQAPMVIGAQVAEPEFEAPTPDAIAGAMQQVERSAVATALAQTKPDVAKPEAPKPLVKEPAKVAAAEVTAKANTSKLDAKAEAKLAKNPPNGGLLPRKATGSSAEVTIAGGATQKAHSFWLDNPRRYVVDVPGKHLTAKAPEGNTLVSRVRVGSYEDKTRYVLEVASNVHDARVEPRGNALIVTLSK